MKYIPNYDYISKHSLNPITVNLLTNIHKAHSLCEALS